MSGRFSFFKLSGWILIVTSMGGALMFLLGKIVAVRFRSFPLELGSFFLMQSVIQMLTIPAPGMQNALALLAARSQSPIHDAELSGALRYLFLRILLPWAILVTVGNILFQQSLMTRFQLTSPVPVWFACLSGVVSLGTTCVVGILQGRQDFKKMSRVLIANNLCLLGFVTLAVLIFPPAASVALGGFALGACSGFAFAVWSIRNEWARTPSRFAFASLLRRFLPLTIGLGVCTYMINEDVQQVSRFFSADESAGYNAARRIGVNLLSLTGPLAYVLFPMVVRNAAIAKKSSVTTQAVVATLIVGSCGALVCSLFPELALNVVLTEAFAAYAHLVGYFCWALLPLAVSILLINTLLAKEAFGVVPLLGLTALAYRATLEFYHPSVQAVIAVLAGFNLLLMSISAIWLWRVNLRQNSTTVTAVPTVSP